MSPDSKEILHNSVYRCEPLHVGGRLEAPHLALPLTRRLMRNLCAVVLVSVRAMGDGRHDCSVRSPVAAQLVGDQSHGLTLLALQQLAKKACGSPAVAMRLDEDIDDVTILIDGAPEIMPPSLDGDEDLVQVPSVAQPALSTLEPASVCRTERDAPQPDRFVGHREAALGQEIFDIAKAHTEAVIQPDGVADDLGGKAVSAVARHVAFHRPSLPRSH